ncbi:MAG: extensin family protein [Sphingomonadaceae bacterium]|nr:extensin family protein [Sphingomonadaceae bacterium]
MFRLFAGCAALLALSGCNLVPDGRGTGDKPRTTSAPVAVSASARQCLAQLDSAGASFSPMPDQYFGAGCSTLNSVRIAKLRGDEGHFELSNLGPVACPTATAFSGWARFGVDRAARQLLGSPLARIETMGSYSCRNVAGSSKRSAHARAEAIDVAAFVLEDGRRISVVGDWSNGTEAERQFLRVVHQSACKRFGTVLGPQYNAAHRDHFHLEQGGGGFCR